MNTTTTNQQTEETPSTEDIKELCENIDNCEDVLVIDRQRDICNLVSLAYIVGKSEVPQGDKETLYKSLQSITELLTYIQTNGAWLWGEICKAKGMLKTIKAK